MIEAGLAQTAEAFWSHAGGAAAAPRDLATIVSRLLPLSIASLPDLSVNTIERWFASRQVPYRFLCHNRALYGCLVAARGHGFLFTDTHDPPEEHRFTVAHEIAHFLLDYDAPRRRALELFGETIRPVLDGERAPTAVERIHAVLASVPPGVFINLMPRSAQGNIDQGAILRAEDRADRLALELLAPADEVLARLPANDLQPFERVRQIGDLHVNEYGLPRTVARTYVAALLPKSAYTSIAQWLGL